MVVTYSPVQDLPNGFNTYVAGKGWARSSDPELSQEQSRLASNTNLIAGSSGMTVNQLAGMQVGQTYNKNGYTWQVVSDPTAPGGKTVKPIATLTNPTVTPTQAPVGSTLDAIRNATSWEYIDGILKQAGFDQGKIWNAKYIYDNQITNYQNSGLDFGTAIAKANKDVYDLLSSQRLTTTSGLVNPTAPAAQLQTYTAPATMQGTTPTSTPAVTPESLISGLGTQTSTPLEWDTTQSPGASGTIVPPTTWDTINTNPVDTISAKDITWRTLPPEIKTFPFWKAGASTSGATAGTGTPSYTLPQFQYSNELFSPSAQLWNRYSPSEREAYQSAVTGTGLSWNDMLQSLQKKWGAMTPSSSQGRFNWTPAGYNR
jgi:hypothetical protein